MAQSLTKGIWMGVYALAEESLKRWGSLSLSSLTLPPFSTSS